MLTPETADTLAAEWIAAWNAHDLDRILSHYAEGIEFTSPFVSRLLEEGETTVRGLAMLRAYFARGLAAYPRTLLLLLALACASCGDILSHYVGVGGQSFLVAGQFTILTLGYRTDDVTWLVVRNWPARSTPEERLADGRLVLGADGEYRVRRRDGRLAPPESNQAYLFDGERLTTFPIRMREADFVSFRPEDLKSYADVETFLRRFERRPGS